MFSPDLTNIEQTKNEKRDHRSHHPRRHSCVWQYTHLRTRPAFWCL